ncbi:MAG: ABC-type transport auxiliary lipoprotein family protein [Rhodanobacteraceae bacterium]
MHSTRADFARHYSLGSSAPAHVADQTANHGRKILQITRITVPSWLAGTAMYYRLDYQGDHRAATYAHSDWIAPPATLLESIIQNTTAANGNWHAVIGPGNPAKADASLRLQLDDFSQAFSQPRDSAGVIDATATLIDNHDDSVISQQHWHIEVAAPTADAQGGVKALGKASRQLANDLQRWLVGVSAPAH